MSSAEGRGAVTLLPLTRLSHVVHLRSRLPDLNADARNLQLNAGLPLLFAPVVAVLFPALSATFSPNLVPVAVAGFDASLLANRAYTFLPTHALGAGLLGNERNRGHRSGGDRKST
jgi:hypothetical protein